MNAMDLKAEKEMLKKELDLVEDSYLLETIRKILEYGKSKALKTFEVMADEDHFDRTRESGNSFADKALVTQEKPIEYFRKKNT